MGLAEYAENVVASYSTENLFFLTAMQIIILVLVYTDMRSRNFSKVQRIILLAFVIFFPVPGAIVYIFAVFFGQYEEVYNCPVCDKSYSEKPETCSNCGFTETPGSFENDVYSCSCGESFNTWIGWRKHVKNQHENSNIKVSIDDSEVNKCTLCGKSFDTERGLHIHQAKVHED